MSKQAVKKRLIAEEAAELSNKEKASIVLAIAKLKKQLKTEEDNKKKAMLVLSIAKEKKKLGGAIKPPPAVDGGGQDAGNPTFEALARGDFDDLGYEEYLEKLDMAYAEINEIDPLKTPAIRYVRKKHEEMVANGGAVSESVENMEERMLTLLEAFAADQRMEQEIFEESDEEEEIEDGEDDADDDDDDDDDSVEESRIRESSDDEDDEEEDESDEADAEEEIEEEIKKASAAKAKETKDVDDEELDEFEGNEDEDEIDESYFNLGKYNTNHSTFTSAVGHARDMVERKGFTISDDDWFRQISTGPRKPVEGDTNRYTLQLMKDDEYTNNYLHVQVYGKRRGFELNMYSSKAARPRKSKKIGEGLNPRMKDADAGSHSTYSGYLRAARIARQDANSQLTKLQWSKARKTRLMQEMEAIEAATVEESNKSFDAFSYKTWEEYRRAAIKMGYDDMLFSKAQWRKLKKEDDALKEDVNEGVNAFIAAAAVAKSKNNKNFNFNDKKYPVTLKAPVTGDGRLDTGSSSVGSKLKTAAKATLDKLKTTFMREAAEQQLINLYAKGLIDESTLREEYESLEQDAILEAMSKAELQKKMMAKFGNDPLYAAVIQAKTKEEGKKAVKGLISVRGKNAMEQMNDFVQKTLKESVSIETNDFEPRFTVRSRKTGKIFRENLTMNESRRIVRDNPDRFFEEASR